MLATRTKTYVLLATVIGVAAMMLVKPGKPLFWPFGHQSEDTTIVMVVTFEPDRPDTSPVRIAWRVNDIFPVRKTATRSAWRHTTTVRASDEVSLHALQSVDHRLSCTVVAYRNGVQVQRDFQVRGTAGSVRCYYNRRNIIKREWT